MLLIEATQKIDILPSFFVEKTSKNRAPVSTRCTFLKIILKLHVILYVKFGLIFSCFFLFFQDTLTWKMKQNVCILQVKLYIIMFCIQKWHTKKVSKKHEKIMKKTVYKPQKWGSRLGETLGFEKASFSIKKENLHFDQEWNCRDPCLPMCFAMNSYDFYTQKKSTFWLHVGSVRGAHVAKTLFFTMNLKHFRGVVFDAKKCRKVGKSSQDGFKSSSHGSR